MRMKERQPWKILDEYRGRSFSGEWPTLPELLEITVHRFPERPFLTIYEPDRIGLSYAGAIIKVKNAAAALLGLGLKRGDRVAVTGKNSPEWATAYLAVLFAGCVVVPIDAQLRKEETENLCRAAGVTVIFCDEEKHDAMLSSSLKFRKVYSLMKGTGDYIYDLGGDVGAVGPAMKAVGEKDLAAILFTSGTTGEPKGVMLSHANLVSDAFLAQGNLDIYPTDVFYVLLPIHHSYTMLAVFIEALAVGAELVFAKRLVISQVLKDLKQAKITMLLGVPMLFNKILAGIMGKIKDKGPLVWGLIRFLMLVSGGIKKATGINPGKKIFKSVLSQASLSSIRICISGGGPLAPAVFRDYNRLGLDFVQGYGLTETSPIITLNPVEAYEPTSVGKVIPGSQMKVIDPDEDGNGELVVKGSMVMQGYWNNEAATREVFTEDGWFKTGDVGHLDSDGYCYLTGRAKNMIVTDGGKNVYPEEIENAFQLYPEIDQVMVRGFALEKGSAAEGIEALIHPDRDWFKAQAEKGNIASAEEEAVVARVKAILAEVNSKLLPYQRIARHEVLDAALEMTTTKKIKRFVAGK